MLRKNKHNLNYSNISLGEWFVRLQNNPSLIGCQSGNSSMGIRFENNEIWTKNYSDKEPVWEVDQKDSVADWMEKRTKVPNFTYWITDKKYGMDIEEIIDML